MSSPTSILFYPFSEGAVLHLEGSHRLWVLNHSSAVLWCLHEEHGEVEGLVAAYADHFDLSMQNAKVDVDNALAEFERNGLLAERPILSSPPSAPLAKAHGSSSRLPDTNCRPGWTQTYMLAGISWHISSTDAAAGKWFDSLAHLETNLPATDLHYELRECSSRWILKGPVETITELAADEVLPWLLTLLFADLCHRQTQHLLLHAAVACRDSQLLLLPGESAFGKSTLAAALATKGWTLYSDELAPLNTQTLEVLPFPLPVGVKSRSLPALQSFHNGLFEQAAWRRADGQLVRYLSPPQLPLANTDAEPAHVSALVFPHYRPDAPTSLARLSPLQALERLVQTGSSERPLCANDIEALLALAGRRPCWSLDYANLEEAVLEVTTAWSLCSLSQEIAGDSIEL